MSRSDDHLFGGRPGAPGIGYGSPVAGAVEKSSPGDDRFVDEQGLGRPFGSSVKPEEMPEEGDESGTGSPGTGRRRRAAEEPAHPRYHLALLAKAVRVVHDERGTPHIVCTSEHDAYAALGFCMAFDRPWELEAVRRHALGRRAEIEGASALISDVRMRLGGVARRASVAAGRMGGRAHELLSGFVGGINAGLTATNCAEAKDANVFLASWTVADCLALELAQAWERALGTACLKLARDRSASASVEPPGGGLSDQHCLAAQPDDAAPAEVVVGPALGSGGVPGLAWSRGSHGGAPYLVRLSAPGIALAGLLDLGWPGFVAGCTRGLAFGLTSGSIDDVDVVVEDVDGIGGFRDGDHWERLQVRREAIGVREGETLRFDVAETRNGPLLTDEIARLIFGCEVSARPVALRWGPRSLASGIEGWFALARGQGVDDVQQAARTLATGPRTLGLSSIDARGAALSVLVAAAPLRDLRARGVIDARDAAARWREVREVVLDCGSEESGVRAAPRASAGLPLWIDAAELTALGAARGTAEVAAAHAAMEKATPSVDRAATAEGVLAHLEPGRGLVSVFRRAVMGDLVPIASIDLATPPGETTFEIVP